VAALSNIAGGLEFASDIGANRNANRTPVIPDRLTRRSIS
jgi:hypothetical protein